MWVKGVVKYQDTIHAVVDSLPKEVAPQILAMASMKRLEKEESFRIEKNSPERLRKQKSLRLKTERPSDNETEVGSGAPTFSVEFPSIDSGDRAPFSVDFGILRSNSSDNRPSMDTPQNSFRLTPNGVTSPRNVQNSLNRPKAPSPLADVEAFKRAYSKEGRSILHP